MGVYECLDKTTETLSVEQKKLYDEQQFSVISCTNITQTPKRKKMQMFIPVSWLAVSGNRFLYPKKKQGELKQLNWSLAVFQRKWCPKSSDDEWEEIPNDCLLFLTRKIEKNP